MINCDHLGSTRQLGNTDMKQDYCPYGKDLVGSGTETDYKFTGKELDNVSGLYYYGARYYDPSIGRWLVPDPMGDRYHSLSPYVYCANNPLMIKDDDGRALNFLAQAGIGYGIGFVLDAGIQVYQKHRGGVRGWDILKINWGQSAKAGAIGAAGALTGVGIASATTKIIQVASLTGRTATLAQFGLNAVGNAGANVAIDTIADAGNTTWDKVKIRGAMGALGSIATDAINLGTNVVIQKKALQEAVDNMLSTEAIGDATSLSAESLESIVINVKGQIVSLADVLGYIISNTPVSPREEEKRDEENR